MPGVFNLSLDQLVEEAREVHSLGIPAIILFGLPQNKDEQASGAWAEDGIVQRATRAVKRAIPDLLVMGDVCLCEYMSHGHCGIVKKSGPTGHGPKVATASAAAAPSLALGAEAYEIDNDSTLEILARTAVTQARAGVDIVAPSDMMDGRVAAIRAALDQAGFQNTPILS
jgi:porphobilinogen synthase